MHLRHVESSRNKSYSNGTVKATTYVHHGTTVTKNVHGYKKKKGIEASTAKGKHKRSLPEQMYNRSDTEGAVKYEIDSLLSARR